ncbi:hypothetical protein COBT_002486 [Conglomerata obtusa]
MVLGNKKITYRCLDSEPKLLCEKCFKLDFFRIFTKINTRTRFLEFNVLFAPLFKKLPKLFTYIWYIYYKDESKNSNPFVLIDDDNDEMINFKKNNLRFKVLEFIEAGVTKYLKYFVSLQLIAADSTIKRPQAAGDFYNEIGSDLMYSELDDAANSINESITAYIYHFYVPDKAKEDVYRLFHDQSPKDNNMGQNLFYNILFFISDLDSVAFRNINFDVGNQIKITTKENQIIETSFDNIFSIEYCFLYFEETNRFIRFMQMIFSNLNITDETFDVCLYELTLDDAGNIYNDKYKFFKFTEDNYINLINAILNKIPFLFDEFYLKAINK